MKAHALALSALSALSAVSVTMAPVVYAAPNFNALLQDNRDAGVRGALPGDTTTVDPVHPDTFSAISYGRRLRRWRHRRH